MNCLRTQLKRSKLLGIAILLLAALPAQATPYYAHPERSFEVQASSQANLLVSESLYALSLFHDGLAEEARSEFYFHLLSAPSISFLLGTPQITHPAQASRFEMTLKGALRSWGRNEPSLSSDPGAFVSTTLST